MLSLIWRDVWFRRGRLIGVVVLMGIVLGLLFLMTGLVGQFRAEPRDAAQHAGGSNDWFLPEGARGPITSGEVVPEDPSVVASGATPVLVARATLANEPVYVVARDGGDVSPPTLEDGEWRVGPGEVVVDEVSGFSVGDTLQLGAVEVEVTGVTSRATVLAGVPFVFSDLTTARNAVASGSPIVTGYLVPEGSGDVPAGMARRTVIDIGDDAARPLDDAVGSVDLVRSLLWLITAIVVAAVMYITALERTRETAVLKACGVTTRRLGIEMLVRAVAFTALALLLAAVLQRLMQPAFPLTVRIPASAWFVIPLGALLVAVLASLAALAYVVRVPPEEAFS